MRRLVRAVRPIVVLTLVLVSLAGCAPSETATPEAAGTAPPEATQTAEATQTPSAEIGTRQSPAEIGQTLPATADSSQFEVSVTEVVTGEEATARVREANQFNEPPGEGREFVLFFATARIMQVPGDQAITVSEFMWSLVDSTGEIHTPPAIVDPEPEFSGSGFEGATIEGWVTFTREVGEQVSLVFGLQPGGAGGTWFAVPGE